MHARQVVITEPYQTAVREVELPPPPRIKSSSPPKSRRQRRHRVGRLDRHASMAERIPSCRTGSFPSVPATARREPSSPSARRCRDWKAGERVSYPGNHASAELLTIGHERGRLWRHAGQARHGESRGGLHRPLRPGRFDPRRDDAGPLRRRVGIGHHRPVRAPLL